MIEAYGECYPKLIQHDARYPRPEQLLERTVPGYGDGDEGVKLILAAVDADDPRPIWFMNWGTDHGSVPSSLKLALDRVLQERGPSGYAAFKNRLHLSSDDFKVRLDWCVMNFELRTIRPCPASRVRCTGPRGRVTK